MNGPMIRTVGGFVDEEDTLISRLNFNSVSSEEFKHIIFDSFASLDDNNGDDFGIDVETASKALESPNRKNAMYEAYSSFNNKSLYCDAAQSRSGDSDTSSNNSVASVTDDSNKPKRPLSAYNLFFQLERERIIAGIADTPFTADDVERVAIARRIHDMQSDKPKRKHRKSHGKITFAELARAIANRWRSLDPYSKGLLLERAALEKSRFLRELEEWTRNNKKTDNVSKGSDNPNGLNSTVSIANVSHIQKAKPSPASLSISKCSRSPRPDKQLPGIVDQNQMKYALEMAAFANMHIGVPSSCVQRSRPKQNRSFGSLSNVQNNYNSYHSLYNPSNPLRLRTHQSMLHPSAEHNLSSTTHGVEPSNNIDSLLFAPNAYTSFNQLYDYSLANELICNNGDTLFNVNHDQTSINQLLANVEHEIYRYKVAGDKISKLLSSIHEDEYM
jgi:hypothetical protein